jgi:cysteinyl-tRNA synthetase
VLALEAYGEDRADDDDAGRRAAGRARLAFKAALDDDLNVSAALAAAFDLVRDLNRRMDERSLSTADARRAAMACETSTACWPSSTSRMSSPLERPSCSSSGKSPESRETGPRQTGCATSWRHWA